MALDQAPAFFWRQGLFKPLSLRERGWGEGQRSPSPVWALSVSKGRAFVSGFWAWRDGFLACRHGAARRRGLLSLLVQRKKQRNTPQAARPPRCALRVREWAGNFRKAHPCAIRKRRPPWRRPAGFTRPTRRASWGPEGNSHSKALSTDMSGPASGPLRSGSHGGSNPVGAAHRDVRRFRMTQDVSSGNSRRDCEPAAKRRAGRRGVLSLPTFFAQAKKVGPPRRAAPCVTSSRLAPKDACKRFVARECFR